MARTLILSILLLGAALGLGAADQAVAPAEVQPSAQAAPAPPAESPLAPVKTDHPRDTMRTFLRAMDSHARARGDGDPMADTWLADAVRCMDVSGLPAVGRDRAAAVAAVELKEVIDRVIDIDLARVPDDRSVGRWRLRNTEISILRQESGDRRDEYLFAADTVARAGIFFSKVKSLPLLPGKLGGGWAPPWQEAYIPASLKPEWFGVAYWQWILIGLLIFIGLVLRQLARVAAFVVKRLTARTAATWDDDLVDALTGPMTHLATTGVWFASLHLIGISGAAYTVIAFLIKGAFFVNLGYLGWKLAGFVGHQIEAHMRQHQQDVNQSLFKLLRQTMQLLALLFCLLLGAQNMGMDVASLIAGLGIGGLAFALAAKDTLANLFGSVMIMIDRPFRVGDYIIVKGVEGSVEEVGFRSTRIRSPNNSLVSIPNSELVVSNIDNMGMRTHRRVREVFGLVYATPPERVEAFCAGVRGILAARPAVKQDAVMVAFSTMAASSLDILVNYHLAVPTWDAEMAERQAILLEVMRLAEALGVGFAFPTQTLHIDSAPGVPAARPEARDQAQLAAVVARFGPGRAP